VALTVAAAGPAAEPAGIGPVMALGRRRQSRVRLTARTVALGPGCAVVADPPDSV